MVIMMMIMMMMIMATQRREEHMTRSFDPSGEEPLLSRSPDERYIMTAR
jgi:hypothetical protein